MDSYFETLQEVFCGRHQFQLFVTFFHFLSHFWTGSVLLGRFRTSAIRFHHQNTSLSHLGPSPWQPLLMNVTWICGT